MARIEIDWLSDSHDCETCGTSYADGAVVRIDGAEVISLLPHAYCYDGDHFEREQVYRRIILALGHELVDGEPVEAA